MVVDGPGMGFSDDDGGIEDMEDRGSESEESMSWSIRLD